MYCSGTRTGVWRIVRFYKAMHKHTVSSRLVLCRLMPSRVRIYMQVFAYWPTSIANLHSRRTGSTPPFPSPPHPLPTPIQKIPTHSPTLPLLLQQPPLGPPPASYQSLGSPYPIQPPTITRCQAPNHSPPTTTLHRNHPVLAHSDAHCATAGTHSHSHSLTLSPQLGFQFRAWKSLGCGRVAPGYGSTFATLARLRRSSWIFTSRLPT